MNIGSVRISKKMAALIGGVAMCEYLRTTGQTMEQIEPIMQMVMVYLGGQSIVDAVAAKAPKGAE